MGADDCDVRGEKAELGVQVESVGLVCCAKVVGALWDDDTKDDVDDPGTAIVVR